MYPMIGVGCGISDVDRTELAVHEALGGLELLVALGDGAKRSRDWVGDLARDLRYCEDAAACKAAGRLLPGAGGMTAFGRSFLFKAGARFLPGIGFALSTGGNLADGKSPDVAVKRALAQTYGSLTFADLAVGACGIGGALSGGAAALGCLGLAAAGSFAGNVAGGAVYDLFSPSPSFKKLKSDVFR
jgi:hypothetical protein